MKFNKYFTSLITTPLILLSSCATIMHGTRQNVGISTNPTDASIWIDNQYIGQSPMIVQLTRKDNHFVRLELPGYQPYEVTFTRQLSAWVLGNVIFGGVIGLAVDAVTGAIYKLTPEQVQAEMLYNQVNYSKAADSYISVVMHADESWEKVGQLSKIN